MPSDEHREEAGEVRRGFAPGVIPVFIGLLAVFLAAIGLLYVHYLNNPVTKYVVRDGMILGEMGFMEHYGAACGGVFMIWFPVTVIVLVKVANRSGSAAKTGAPAAAGWYADPHARHELRYWSGSEWTEHVSDRGETSVDAGSSFESPRTE